MIQSMTSPIVTNFKSIPYLEVYTLQKGLTPFTLTIVEKRYTLEGLIKSVIYISVDVCDT